MAIRIDTPFQAIYAWEDEGHTLPALNTALAAGGPMRIEAPTADEALVCGFYGVSTGTLNYWSLIKLAGSNLVELRGYNGSLVTSGTYALPPGQYHISIEHDSGTVRARLDGVVILSMAFVPLAGTAGDRSFQIGGYGEAAGIIDCTVERWRMWSGLLDEAQWRAEFRSEVPVRTVGLLHNWPMVAGSGRLNDTVPGEPDLSENTAVPVGDGTAITLRPRPYGTPQFFPLGDSATPGAQTITVPRWAKWVAILIEATDDTVPDVDTTSVVSDFAGTFTLDNIGASATSAGGCIATAQVLSYGTGRTFTITFDAANTLAGAGAWVVFLQDTAAAPITDTDHGEASGDGTTPGVASASGVAGGVAIALDSRLDNVSGAYPANEAGWDSLGTGQSGPGGIGYYGATRLRQKAITATGTETATTQTTFASIVSLLTLQPSPALASVAPTAPVVEPGDVTNSGNNTAQSSWAVNTPALATGDLITVNLAWDDSTTISSVTAPAGQNGETAVLIDGPEASASTEVRCAAWRYIATGAWSAGTLAFAPVGGSEQWTASVLKVPAGEFDASTPTGAASTRSSAGTAESQVLSPAYSLGASDGGGRLVAWLVADDDPFIADATGWTQLANVDRGAVAGLLAARDLETSNSEAVTAGTWRIASDSWCSLAYVIRKASTATDGTATGQTLPAAASLIPGSASGVRSPTQTGQTLSAAAALIAGLATGQTNITANGVLVSAAASLIAGAASGARNPTAAGSTLVTAALIVPGVASGVRSPTAAGQVLTASASLIAGSASSGASGTADGVALTAATSLVAGSASGVRNATAQGATISAGASLLPGAPSAVRSPTQAGATLPLASSLIAGAASASTNGTASGQTLTAAAALIPGSASANNGAVAPGALQQTTVGVLPGDAVAARNATAFGAFLELLTTFLPGTGLTLSSEPSLYAAHVPAQQVRAIVPAGNFTAFVPADDVAAAVPEGDYTATV